MLSVSVENREEKQYKVLHVFLKVICVRRGAQRDRIVH